MIAVTGATGGLGRRVAARLGALRVPQRLVVRDPLRAPRHTGAEVVAVEGGYADGDGMRAAFEGCDTVLLVSAAESPDRVGEHAVVIAAAAAAGVRRIVYTSFVAAAPDATFTFARDHFHTEQRIKASRLAFTFLRDSLYLDFVPLLVVDGVIRGPAGDGRVAPVARDDVADVAAAVLTQDGHDGQTYDLTGAERFSMAELAKRFGARFEDETLAEARAWRAGLGEPFEVEGWVTTYAAIAAGELDVLSTDVARLTGRQARTLEDVLRAQRNEAIVRSGFDALDGLDTDALTAAWADDVVWDVSGYEGWPGDHTRYVGAAHILAAYASFAGTVEVLKVDIHEITEVRPDRVLALYTETRRRHGELATEQLHVGIVQDLREGQIVRMAVLDDHERARDAASSP